MKNSSFSCLESSNCFGGAFHQYRSVEDKNWFSSFVMHCYAWKCGWNGSIHSGCWDNRFLGERIHMRISVVLFTNNDQMKLKIDFLASIGIGYH
jgi:hypothetical protein